MAGNKFHFSAGFFDRLIELTDGAIPSVLLENVITQLENETQKYFFTASSESNLIRIFSAVYDSTFFFRDLSKYPHHIEILVAVAANSNYLTDIVVRNPEFLYQIFDQTYLSITPGYDQFKNDVEGIQRFRSFTTKLKFLRQIKKRHLLRIGLSDILGMTDLKSVTGQLSFLAKSILTKLFEISHDEILTKYRLQDINVKYCLCSLGKLGGNELNYSSDVDLILFYDKNESFELINKDYQEILAEAALLFIKSATEITGYGYIYRIDFRLRPDGKNSHLCKEMVEYTKYYETRGEDWERQMLIKLNFICGDEKLYSRFYDFIQPFIFPQSFSESVKDKIREMKINIERQNVESGNVKTFSGGIRDIEFSVQALQMINGGKTKSLRNPNTMESIAALSSFKLLKKKESGLLTNAYIFYRRIEHYLQLMDDRQTHIITDDEEHLNRISFFLNFNSVNDFKQKLTSFRNDVRSVYNKILSAKDTQGQIFLKEINITNRAKAEKNIAYLRSGKGIIERKEFDVRTIEMYDVIEPHLLKFLKKAADPDKVLDNFVKIIQGTKFPSIWYHELANKKSFINFLNICQFSQNAVDLISSGKETEDQFLSHRVFVKNIEDMTAIPMRETTLCLAVQHSLKLISAYRFSQILTSVIKQKIAFVLENYRPSYKFFVGGLGSFGGSNMAFSSDVDLIFVADDIESNPGIQKEFQNLALSFNDAIKPFTVDFKLRPEGNKSPLVCGINEYEDYLNKRARVWEFQALQKLNYVSGDKKLFLKFRKIIYNRIKALNPEAARKDIIDMYNEIQRQNLQRGGFNIKKDRGGLVTIDFILQLICFNDNRAFSKYLGKTVPQLFVSIKDNIDGSDLALLKRNYNFLKNTALAIQNISGSRNMIVSSSTAYTAVLVNFLGYKSYSEFEINLNETIKSNNLLFEKYANR